MPPSPVERIPEPPRGSARVRWIGPGVLWMVSAAGSGELLFTPRVGSQYGYVLLWALCATVTLKWFINRELGRWAVCTGSPVLAGFTRLGGPRNWAVWLILAPQAIVAVAGTAGLAGAAGSAFALFLPGGSALWTVASLVTSGALVWWGRYTAIEIVAKVWGALLALAAIAAALGVLPSVAQLAAGLVPRLPCDVDYGEVLPWIGFTLAGAAGLIWYSYWLPAKGYGAAAFAAERELPPLADPQARRKLRGWITQMTLDNTVAVVGALIVTAAFLVLGTELLRPHGLVPGEDDMAQTLATMMERVWGPFGFWFMVVGLAIGFWSTALSGQDGHGRMFAHGSRLLARNAGLLSDEPRMRRLYVIVLLVALPAAVYLLAGKPVTLLQITGAIEAMHIPVVAAVTLWLNLRLLPEGLRPGPASVIGTALAGVFFAVFAAIYVVQIASG